MLTPVKRTQIRKMFSQLWWRTCEYQSYGISYSAKCTMSIMIFFLRVSDYPSYASKTETYHFSVWFYVLARPTTSNKRGNATDLVSRKLNWQLLSPEQTSHRASTTQQNPACQATNASFVGKKYQLTHATGICWQYEIKHDLFIDPFEYLLP